MGSLLAVDDLVAGSSQLLKQTGERDDTVIVFTSDNGWILGEHRLRDPVTETAGRRRQVRPLRGLLAGAADDRRPRASRAAARSRA